MVDISDIFNETGKEFQKQLVEIQDINDKIQFVQQFLIKQLVLFDRNDSVVEFAVNRIIAKKGLLQINSLSQEMGYSRRYIDGKFIENVGLSPKEFSNIIRFQEIFKNLPYHVRNQSDLYYDQSHYIKHFKKFTGMAPGEYITQCNKLRCLLDI